MAKAGDSIDNPVTGERIIVLQSGQETAGDLFAFELSMRPHGFVSAEHIHPKQEEAFEVTRGTIRFRINGQEMDAATGRKVVILPGMRHVLWNPSDEEASMTVWLRPALKTETAFETLFGLVNVIDDMTQPSNSAVCPRKPTVLRHTSVVPLSRTRTGTFPENVSIFP